MPIGFGERQKFLFSRVGALVDKDAKNRWGESQLGIYLPSQTTKMADIKFMKPEELQRAKLREPLYYCAPKQLLYSKDTFKGKKARLLRSPAPPVKGPHIIQQPPKNAYMYHSYSECRCGQGGRQVILEVELTATVDALLPSGTLGVSDWLSPDRPNVIRIRDIVTGQTKLLEWYSIYGSWKDLKRGQKLWYSPKMKQYFTEQKVKDNLKTEADYKDFLDNPPKKHSHH